MNKLVHVVVVAYLLQGQEVVSISSVWVEFLRQITASSDKAR